MNQHQLQEDGAESVISSSSYRPDLRALDLDLTLGSYRGDASPTPDQEYYEILSSRSHVLDLGGMRGKVANSFGPANGGLEDVDEDAEHSTATSFYDNGGLVSERMDTGHGGWDAFKLRNTNSGERCEKVFLEVVLQISKVAAYVLIFILILLCGIASKLSFGLLLSNVHFDPDAQLRNCRVDGTATNVTSRPVSPKIHEEKYVAVIWSVCFCLLAPEILTWLSCLRKVILRQIQGPRSAITWVLAIISETCHTIGLLLLTYDVIGSSDLVSGLMLTSACCFVPSILAPLNRSSSESVWPIRLLLDVISICAQFSALVFWSFVERNAFRWTLPVALILISIRYWENYVTDGSPFRLIRWLSAQRTNIGQAQCKVYLFVSLWKICLMVACMAAWHSFSGPTNVDLFNVKDVFTGSSVVELGGKMVNNTWVERRQKFWYWKPNAVFLLMAVISVTAGFVGNMAGKYACRIRIHVFSFAVPVTLVTPATVAAALAVCGELQIDPCGMRGFLSSLININCPPYESFSALMENQHAWLWFFWMLSHWWIVGHIWRPVPERRKTNHLFALPEYGSFPFDLSSTLTRMRSPVEATEKPTSFSNIMDVSGQEVQKGKAAPKQDCSNLYLCTFLERESDVIETLKSIIRLDEEQSARKNALKFLIQSDPDYFEFESHLFFDNAFFLDTLRGERILDRQAAKLIPMFDEAASDVHDIPVTLRPPKKVTTPYGGSLRWHLPGGNTCVVHLKDCNLIRAGHRWSQTMALYYVLGHKIMQQPCELERKQKIAENSFVLFTAGSVRFKPTAVTRLLDVLKSGRHIGAATCRLNPIGTGPLVWYQKYEYSMRYWLERATEHMLGSLLRSRSGFTMYRAAALMDDNVVRKFAIIPEDSKEFMQFRLGNEQWLCALLLKQGYKVEYCAAVDVSVHVPETFSDYCEKSQREIPLQMAAMTDVISNYSHVLEQNENITLIFIGYLMLSLVSDIFAFGTVFLVIVTALVDLFKMNMFLALASNAAPVLVFVSICLFCSPRSQNLIMKIFSIGYGMVMLAVLISASVQLHTSWLSASPVSIFMIAFVLTTVLPAIFHPQELTNVVFAPLFFIAIPTTYLLNVIHALCTFHLANGQKKKEEEDLAQQIEKWEKLAAEAQKDPNKSVNHRIPSIDVIEQLKKYLPNGKKSVTFACGQFCGIVCCPPPEESLLEGPFGDLIGRELLDIGRQLQVLEHRLRARRMGLQGFRPRMAPPEGMHMPLNMPPEHNWDLISEASGSFSVSTVRTTVKSPEEFYERFGRHAGNDKLTEWLMSLHDSSVPLAIENDHWMEDEDLARAEAAALDSHEAAFWRELITTYALPLTGTTSGLEEGMVGQMKKIRNKVALGFLMLNSLFILMVFLLELRREELFIWIPSPFASSGSGKKPAAVQIEPTGVAFLLFFFVLMLVQFLAMLMHRWGTFSQLLATTEVSCFKRRKRVGFDYLRQNAIQIARELQSLKNAKEEDTETRMTSINLQHKPATSTLDVVFRKRFLAAQKHSKKLAGRSAVRRGTLDVTNAPNGTELPENQTEIRVFHLDRNNKGPDGRGSIKSSTSS